MSGSDYVTYTIPERTRRELERERRKREEEVRKREEERRRRETEERRRRRLEEWRQLASDMERLREAGSMIREEISSRKTKAGSTEVDGAPGEVESVRETVGRIERALSLIPQRVRKYLTADLAGIENVVRKAKDSGYDRYWLPGASLAWEKTREIMGRLEEIVKEREEKRRQLEERLDKLIVSLRMVIDSPVEEGLGREASSLLEELESLQGEEDMEVLSSRLDEAERKYSDILERHREFAMRLAEKDYVMSCMRDVLEQMGYKTLELPGQTLKLPGSREAFFLTPDGEAVRVLLGSKGDMHCQLYRLALEGQEEGASTREEMVEKCRNWCADYDRALQILRERGLGLEEKWRIEPERMDYAILALSRAPAVEESVAREQGLRKETRG